MLEIKRIERQNLKGESRAVKSGGKLVSSCEVGTCEIFQEVPGFKISRSVVGV